MILRKENRKPVIPLKPKAQKLTLAQQIVKIVRNKTTDAQLADRLSNFHENDLADAFERLTVLERQRLYNVMGPKWVAEILAYIEYPEDYFEELGIDRLAALINEMDSDDAADILETVDPQTKDKLRPLLKDEVKKDIRLIYSYRDNEIGSLITNNYISILNTLTIKQAMKELVKQAGDNDNIQTLYVVDENNAYCGAIELKDLIIARENASLEDLIIQSYPSVKDKSIISECIEELKDYTEDSLPVVDENNKLMGILTAQAIADASNEEMSEDYAKLAGLTEAEDLKESTFKSMKKRLPWLIVLLFLGMAVSTVVGTFESVVAALPIVMCFQSLILDMAGNVGTQSLAVTIRVLSDCAVSAKDKAKLVLKECRVGLFNGILLGIIAFLFVGCYNVLFKGYAWSQALLISGCVGVSLMAAMLVSSLIGTLVPMFFNKIKIDPAVASGPLITTVNDLVAIVTYYGLSWLLLIKIFGLS